MAQPSTKEIMRRVRETLDSAKLGLADIKRDPARRHSGLRNLVVFGRAVTNVLQNLRASEKDFESWYKPYVQEMKTDALMKFFYELRTRILKRGETGVANYLHIKELQFPRDMAKFGPPPKNAKSFFMGDQTGGTGWEVEVQPGVTEKYYVDLPAEVGVAGLYFHDAPGIGKERDVNAADVIALSERYIAYLDNLVGAAEHRFSA